MQTPQTHSHITDSPLLLLLHAQESCDKHSVPFKGQTKQFMSLVCSHVKIYCRNTLKNRTFLKLHRLFYLPRTKGCMCDFYAAAFSPNSLRGANPPLEAGFSLRSRQQMAAPLKADSLNANRTQTLTHKWQQRSLQVFPRL